MEVSKEKKKERKEKKRKERCIKKQKTSFCVDLLNVVLGQLLHLVLSLTIETHYSLVGIFRS